MLSWIFCSLYNISHFQLFTKESVVMAIKQAKFKWLQRDSTLNHLMRKRTLNHLAELPKWLSCVVSTYLYGTFDYMFLSSHVRVSEWIYALCLPECQGIPCSKQVQYLKFKWLQRDSNPPQPLSL